MNRVFDNFKKIAKKLFRGFKNNMKINVAQKQNLFHLFKRRNVNFQEISRYVKIFPQTEKRIGTLPSDWFKNLSRDEYAKVTLGVDEALQQFAIDRVEAPGEFDKTQQTLVETLKKILRRDDVKTEHLGMGAYKLCQKLIVGDYTYALSTFKYEATYSPKHGKYAEPQKIFWVYKNYLHGRVAKPFMSHFSCSYLDKGGYILSKYIDAEDKKRAMKPLNILREIVYRLYNRDKNPTNEINGVCIDVGGFEENTKIDENILNKEFRKNLVIFLDRIERDGRTPESPIRNNAEKLLLEQIENGSDIFNIDFRILDTTKFSQDEVREAIRIVRRLRAVHKLKNELKSKGEFWNYYPYLEKFKHHCSKILLWELEK